jgi:hypothetical protein
VKSNETVQMDNYGPRIRSISSDDSESCLGEYNATWENSVFSMLLDSLRYEEYLKTVLESPIPPQYKWKVKWELESKMLGKYGWTEKYHSVGIAEPAGLITEIETLPIPCIPGATGVHSGSVSWEKRFECDGPQSGTISFSAEWVVLLYRDRIDLPRMIVPLLTS